MRGSRESVDGVLTSRCSRTGDARACPVWIVRASKGLNFFTPFASPAKKRHSGDSKPPSGVLGLSGGRVG